jgi:hypothetical protein
MRNIVSHWPEADTQAKFAELRGADRRIKEQRSPDDQVPALVHFAGGVLASGDYCARALPADLATIAAFSDRGHRH